MSHFNELFNSSTNDLDCQEIGQLFPNVIAHEDNLTPVKDVSVEEIKLVVKQLESLKASGPDGLQGLFFIRYWKEVLVNGSPSISFQPSNGIRQGDSLSPFIFILCLEALSRLIQRGINNKSIDGFAISRGAPKITHSLYADDNVIFVKANYKNACNLRKILDKFCRWSGQIISKTKFTLITSSNLGRSFTKGMARALNVQVATNPGKYLGIHMQWGRISAKTYLEIVEKIENRLHGWKARDLNIAGRITLLKSVLDPVTNYVMSLLKLPKGLYNKLNRYKRDFLWGGDKESTKMLAVPLSMVVSS
ncbi:uncharacterized protein LOC113273634 [Papaver somniferum]|uniref:uncharacterized protein LOC113273634 n=1 Tax=Papaver somniferum TaxID=3469 RepID=UPI000E702DDA|nr:uncharacterized protein LOC113273634 [Papaver somniferum]